MHRLTKTFLLISIAFAMGIMVLVQSSCSKESVLSKEEFVYKIQGEWYVETLFHSPIPNDTIWVEIQVSEDGVYYRNAVEQHYYLFDDPVLCTLPHMEEIQHWTITENNGDLFLETRDLCGVIKHYNMEYSNYHYSDWGGGINTAVLKADIDLVNQDTIITIKYFSLNTGLNPDNINFEVVNRYSRDSFNLNRFE